MGVAAGQDGLLPGNVKLPARSLLPLAAHMPLATAPQVLGAGCPARMLARRDELRDRLQLDRLPHRLGLEAGRSRPAPDSRERWPNTRTGALRARIRSGSLRIQVCNSVHPPVGTGTLRSDLTTPVRAAVMTEPHDVSSPRRLCALNACSGNPTRSRLEPLGRRPRDGRTAQP